MCCTICGKYCNVFFLRAWLYDHREHYVLWSFSHTEDKWGCHKHRAPRVLEKIQCNLKKGGLELNVCISWFWYIVNAFISIMVRKLSHSFRINVVNHSQVSPIMLNSAQCCATKLTSCVITVDGFVLGQTARIMKLFSAHFTRKYVFSLLKINASMMKVLPVTYKSLMLNTWKW